MDRTATIKISPLMETSKSDCFNTLTLGVSEKADDVSVGQESHGMVTPSVGVLSSGKDADCRLKPSGGMSIEEMGKGDPDTLVVRRRVKRKRIRPEVKEPGKPDSAFVQQQMVGIQVLQQRDSDLGFGEAREGMAKPGVSFLQENKSDGRLDSGTMHKKVGGAKESQGGFYNWEGKTMLSGETLQEKGDKFSVEGVQKSDDRLNSKLVSLKQETDMEFHLRSAQEMLDRRKQRTERMLKAQVLQKCASEVVIQRSILKCNQEGIVIKEKNGTTKPVLEAGSDTKVQDYKSKIKQAQEGSDHISGMLAEEHDKKKHDGDVFINSRVGRKSGVIILRDSDLPKDSQGGDMKSTSFLQVSDEKTEQAPGLWESNKMASIFKPARKPRSERSSGAKRLTWGSVDFFQMVLSKGSDVKLRKKRRCRETASDGDVEWEAVTGESREETYSRRKSIRGKALNGVMSSNLNGDVAAVMVGLRADTPGPAEKIRFKDVLKRRGGLQEYLECRNMILGLWERDVRRVLCITDCGISSVASSDETSRESLLREIYDFLNYHGYINLGIISKQLDVKSEAQVAPDVCQDAPMVNKEGAANQKQHAADMGSMLHQERRLEADYPAHSVNALDPQPMDIDENPVLQQCNNLSTNSITSQESVQDMVPHSPSGHCEEESLLDVVNRLKIKKKGALQKSDGAPVRGVDLDFMMGDKMEARPSHDSASNGQCSKAEISFSNAYIGKTLVEQVALLEGKVLSIQKVAAHNAAMGTSTTESIHANMDIDCNQKSLETNFERETVDNAYNLHISNNSRVTEAIEEPCHSVIIVGAGPAGLAAGRHFQNLSISVTILEARDRVGGRVFTDRAVFSGPVDLGASIITGVEADVASDRRPDPSALLCKQLDLDLTTLGGDCPLYDSVAGSKVPSEIDEALEAEYNRLLDDTLMLVAQNGDVAMKMSLEEGLELVLRKRMEYGKRASLLPEGLLGRSREHDQNGRLSSKALDVSLERRVMDWHFANLEYGCAAELNRVSLPYWNQDDVYGGFAGPHCMIKGGYGTVMEALGEGLPIHLGQVVSKIEYYSKEEQLESGGGVKVYTISGDVYTADAVLVTIPLGCLKANAIDFVPSLPGWKTASIQRLGFGVLNKVVMEFPSAFWDETVDFFGATAEKTEIRGRCFMFWNLKRTVGAPVLSALVVGKAAIEEEDREAAESVEHALHVLRCIFGEGSVPQPTAFAVTKWGSDPYSRGAYSYVAVGASGEDYDIIGRSVENCVFFAGEATCKEHPDTVGGAMMTGLREAVRIIDVLHSRGDSVAEAEVMAASQRQSDTERNEVRDMIQRLTAAEYSIALRQDGGKLDEQDEPFNKAILLRDMFGSAKTTSGRLLLAKEMLELPAASLRAFAGTKEGLTILNGWIQDSMGKDGTQLLRHCVRLLLVVGKDLSSVRQSGIGRTVKEKVVVHTSRDIRAVASQLVQLWVEMFRKEKFARSIGKPLRPALLGFKTPGLFSKFKKARAGISLECRGKISGAASSAGGGSSSDLMASEEDRGAPNCSNGVQIEQVLGPISDSEAAALAAAQAAQAAADAAVKAYETAEAASTHLQLPKILSFHKFANKREHMTPPESIKRQPLEREVLVMHGKDRVTKGVDARSCKVRNWSIDFTDSCSYLGSPSTLAVQDAKITTRHGTATTIPDLSVRSSVFPESLKEGHTVSEERQGKPAESSVCLESDGPAFSLKEAAGVQESKAHLVSSFTSSCDRGTLSYDSNASSMLTLKSKSNAHVSRTIISSNGNASLLPPKSNSSMLPPNSSTELPSRSVLPSGNAKQEETCLDTSLMSAVDARQCSEAPALPNVDDASRHNARSSEHKRAVTDYISNLLLPLYKTRKIDKDGFKSIVKKSAVKVIERQTDQEAALEVSEFLDTKRKVKIRALVDKFVEKYLENTGK